MPRAVDVSRSGRAHFTCMYPAFVHSVSGLTGTRLCFRMLCFRMLCFSGGLAPWTCAAAARHPVTRIPYRYRRTALGASGECLHILHCRQVPHAHIIIFFPDANTSQWSVAVLDIGFASVSVSVQGTGSGLLALQSSTEQGQQNTSCAQQLLFCRVRGGGGQEKQQ